MAYMSVKPDQLSVRPEAEYRADNWGDYRLTASNGIEYTYTRREPCSGWLRRDGVTVSVTVTMGMRPTRTAGHGRLVGGDATARGAPSESERALARARTFGCPARQSGGVTGDRTICIW